MSGKQKPQTFNDGVVNLYTNGNTAAEGDMPKDGLILKHEKVRFHKRTVGLQRYWSAMQNKVQIDNLIRIPKLDDIVPGYIAVINGGDQYEVKQVQEPEGVYPIVMDLSLERLEHNYGTD